ncbi:SusC/RagA family TonB-linked outer membrane protein [uncultured Chryseobacterium sp.]|uniref:SusC/RagA family TonB-linked outer membrane protein n=1 Tax=uncultured Chryseobacterium sp. TaxID=259322 RepID=UPI0025CBDB44|nr:SusC/RagA family TonB-linked outer membrane protein [uncultured Chryseobacterium sp.]
MKNFTTVLKIAPAFLLASAMVHAQTDSTTKEKKIDEVVLVGYGKQKKSDLTGAITAISEKDFNKGAIVSADQLIAGKAPGVRITSSGGSPDAAPNIRIRGGSSFSANNNPLIVIDGVPLETSNPAGVSNPLNLINPNDIESFSILKDASATAIYGNRGSNGVIIIKTKRGGGKLRVNLNTNVSVGTVSRYIDVMDASEFTRFINQNYPDFNYLLGVGGDPNNKTVPGKIYNTDWQKVIYRNSVSSDNNLSISGSLFNKVPTRLSLGYNRTEGVIRTSDYERFSAGLNITPTFFDNHLKIDFSLKGLFSKLNAIDDGGAIGGALNMNPTLPVYAYEAGLTGQPYDRFGGYYQNVVLKGNQYLIQGQSNPLAILLQRQSPQKVTKFLGNAEINYKFHFLPDLRAIVNLGLEASKSDLKTVFSNNAIATYRNPQNAVIPNDYVFSPGLDYAENQTIVNQTMDAYLVYEKKYSGFLSHFLIQGGYSYQNFKRDGYKDQYRYDDASGLRVPNPGTALNPNNRYYNLLNLQSFLGRANIDFYDKYLFTLNFRADASSLFQKSKRWGYFPGVGFAWKVNKDFFKESANVNELKLRLGWGRTGNADIIGIAGYYPSSAYFSIGGSNSQYFPGVGTYSALPFNPGLSWETTETWNGGIDFSFFRQERLSGSVDIYQRKTTDLLAKVTLPPGQGLTNEFTKNIGSLENKGVELNLTVIPVKTEKTNWSVSGNFGYNDSKILDLGDVKNIQVLDSTLPVGTGVKLATNTVGGQPYSAWVLQQVYDANGKPLDNVYVDRNNDGIINENDRYFKAIRPRWTYGFSTTFTYKNWDLNAAFRGQIGGLIYNTRKIAQGLKSYTIPSNSLNLNNTLASTADSPFTISDNLYLSDYFLEDATFLKLDNVTLGYVFKNVFKSTNVRVYASVNNVYTWTNYTGQDPENFTGIDNNFYPRPRTYTVGFNFNF